MTTQPGAKTVNVTHITGVHRIVNRELVPFSRQLAAMMRAGMSIVVSLTTVEEQIAMPSFRFVVNSIKNAVESGGAFSDGLARFPQIFDDLYVNIVRAGERSGQFSEAMRRLSMLLEANARLRRKVKSAMAYPVVVLCLSIGIAIAMVTFVVPVFASMYKDFDAQLPGPTRILLAASDFMKRFWWLLALVATALVMLFRFWKRTPAGALAFDRLKLRVPVFGQLVQKVAVARFARVFSQMVHSGVPFLDGLKIVAKACGNLVIGASLLEARRYVERGESLHSGLEGKEGIPLLVTRMVAAGERSGKLDEMLDNIADTYEDEVETTLSALTSLIEPMLMVFLGVLIGSIVIAMFLPIFKMSTILKI
ncbi:MAG: type II secretion system F family protein [Kiritimatiellae bacterium]|nr:type II secretion system F family protein [Kiritimatiellia bacterium]